MLDPGDEFALYLDNDNVVQLRLTDALANGAPLTGATVHVTLLRADGSPLPAPFAWPLAMAEVAPGTGVYRAGLPPALAPAPRERLTARLVADGGPGRRFSGRATVRALDRVLTNDGGGLA